MRKPDLKLRTALMSVSDNDNTPHPLKTRVSINIEATLPLFLADPALITNTAINAPVLTTGAELVINNCGLIDDLEITDTDYIIDRFIFVTRFTASVTKVSNKVYYDKLCEDLIVIPDMYYFDKFDTFGKPVELSGYRVGGINPASTPGFKLLLSLNPEDTFKLPVAKSKVANTVTHNIVPGIYTRHGKFDVQMEHLVNNAFNYYRTDGTPTAFINLGKITELFNTAADKELPLQMFYQEAPGKFSVFGLGITKTNDQDLYILLHI